MPRLNSFGTFFCGHFSVQRPQPVHISSFTYLAFFFIVTSKLPTKPFTSVTSEYEKIRMFSCCATSTIFGVRIHAAQSRVGKVLSSCAIFPPIVGFVSTMSTGNPASAMSRAVCIPAMPPPITSARFVTGLSPGVSGALRFTFATAALASMIAFSVPIGISLCTHEHCSRMLAISTMYGFKPAAAAVLRKVASCIRGEHEQTTIPVRLLSLTACLIMSCPAWEHIYW